MSQDTSSANCVKCTHCKVRKVIMYCNMGFWTTDAGDKRTFLVRGALKNKYLVKVATNCSSYDPEEN